MFTAELTEEFTARTEKIKKTFVVDTLKKVELLKEALNSRKSVVQ